MRLFVSLPLNEPMRRPAEAVAEAISIAGTDHDVRWVDPQNLHVTLKFLGEVGDAELPALTAALAKTTPAGPVHIAMGAPDPKRHRGRVHLITAEIVDAGGNLGLLRESIERALEPLGYPREKRAFWPHVTIGRSRRGVRMSYVPFSARGIVGTIDHFELMSSTPGPGGPTYVPVAVFPLAKQQP